VAPVKELIGIEQPDIQVDVVTSPMHLLDKLSECDVLIVVDACQVGLPPSTVVVRERPAILEGDELALSHGFGVSSVLQLAQSLGQMPARIIFFGVQFKMCELG
jgi:hydrogenase maturation protease